MSLDWSALVDSALESTAGQVTPSAVFPSSSGNTAKGVGTEIETQAIDSKGMISSCSHVPTVPPIFEGERPDTLENAIPMACSAPGGGRPAGAPAPTERPGDQGCASCTHLGRPGLSDGYCGGRPDLPFAYGPGHPLRQLPADGGLGCGTWVLHPALGA